VRRTRLLRVAAQHPTPSFQCPIGSDIYEFWWNAQAAPCLLGKQNAPHRGSPLSAQARNDSRPLVGRLADGKSSIAVSKA